MRELNSSARFVFLPRNFSYSNVKMERKKKQYGQDFSHPITHLSHSKNPKPVDPEWAKY